MKDKIKEISNQELLQVHNLIVSHLEYLETEKNKVLEFEKEKEKVTEEDKK